MLDITPDEMTRLVALCGEYGIVKLELFGSAATDAFDPETSDVDLIASFDERGSPKTLKRLLGLEESMEALFARKVDLLMSPTFDNPFMQRSVDATRKVIYERQATEAVA